MAYSCHGMLAFCVLLLAITLVKAQSISEDPDCGVSKGCFHDCDGSNCNFLITWMEDGNDGVYTLMSAPVSTSGTYLALGFSSDREMDNDGVHGCESDANGNVTVFSTINPDRDNPTSNIYDDAEVVLTSHVLTDTLFSCTFRRPNIGSSNGRRDITQPWILLFAKGRGTIVNGRPSLEFHGNNRWASTEKVRINDMVVVMASQLEYPLVKAHGSLMIVAWIFLASVGVVTARYFKPVLEGTICSQKVWFQIHRTCMGLVFVTTAIGFIIIFCEVEGWSDLEEEEKQYLRGHPIMGIIVMALTLMNPIMAFFRPHPGTSKRPIFNWAHWFVGTAAHILGVVTIFFGVLLGKADAPHYLIYILAGYVAWQVLVEIVLELLTCQGREQPKKDAYEMNGSGDQKSEPAVESDKTKSIKRFIFVVHFFVVTAIAAVLIALIAVGERELEEHHH